MSCSSSPSRSTAAVVPLTAVRTARATVAVSSLRSIARSRSTRTRTSGLAPSKSSFRSTTPGTWRSTVLTSPARRCSTPKSSPEISTDTGAPVGGPPFSTSTLYSAPGSARSFSRRAATVSQVEPLRWWRSLNSTSATARWGDPPPPRAMGPPPKPTLATTSSVLASARATPSTLRISASVRARAVPWGALIFTWARSGVISGKNSTPLPLAPYSAPTPTSTPSDRASSVFG